MVVKFVEKEIIEPFQPLIKIDSEYATAFMAASVQEFMERHGIDRKAVLPYAPVANERAERMVGNIKHGIKRSVVRNKGNWVEEISLVLYVYRRRDRGKVPSPFRLMYGINTRMIVNETVSVHREAEPRHRLVELLGESIQRASEAERTGKSLKEKGPIKFF